MRTIQSAGLNDDGDRESSESSESTQPHPGSTQHDRDQMSYDTVIKGQAKKRRRQIFCSRDRIGAALLGSAGFLVHMLIMSIKPSQTKSLITSSACIAVFALLMVWYSSGTPSQVMASTAAYAAVLVVFVGTQ